MTLAIFAAALCIASTARSGPTSKTPRPIPAPPALLKERGQCQHARNTETCLRSKLRNAYQGLAWARKERERRQHPYGVQHALRLASALYGVPLRQLRAVAECESHLYPLAKNRTSTAAGLFQFLDSTWNRAGVPGFSPFDPYANAIAAARLVRSDGGWHEWSCGWAAR